MLGFIWRRENIVKQVIL